MSQKFYSKSTGGFYDSVVHADSMPGDAKAITDETYLALLSDESSGKIISTDDNDLPITIPPPPVPIEQLREDKSKSIYAAFQSAISSNVSSSALGQTYIYAGDSQSLLFLNSLVTLGGGGKFACADGAGNLSRRQHTNEQLLQVGHDIKVAIEANFDKYEALQVAIASAATPDAIAAIEW